MAKRKEITPNFNTPDDQINEVEQFKLKSGIRGSLKEDFGDLSAGDVQHETEALAKSHGIYLEFNRAATGKEKDWRYMVRISIPGGGPLNRKQWQILDDLATRYTANQNGQPSIRMTTRQNIQYHWIRKQDLIPAVQQIASTGYFSLNGCGDNVRNVMDCPMSIFSDVYNANALEQRFGTYFQLDAAPHVEVFAIDPDYVREVNQAQKYSYGPKLLNRKFKIAFSTVHRDPQSGKLLPDNCVELRTNDMGVAPVVEGEKVTGYQVYIGGGQGERNGKASFAALAKPLCILEEEHLQAGLDAVVKIHEQWGDRQNRHWARLKYVVNKMGIPWYQDQLRERGIAFQEPNPRLDLGSRELHQGWMTQPSNGKWAYGAFIECGRIIDDSANGRLRAMCRHIMEQWDTQLLITPNQDIIFTDIEEGQKEAFEADLKQFNYGQRKGKDYSTLRLHSGACVALPTCRLAYTESEMFLPMLIDELETRGYGDLTESIGVTGCERQCFRPATKSIGWVGSGKSQYLLKVMGSEDGSTQGRPVIGSDERHYLRMVPQDRVADVCAVLFDHWQENRRTNESLGTYHLRIGMDAIIAILKENSLTSDLTEKTVAPIYIHDDYETARI